MPVGFAVDIGRRSCYILSKLRGLARKQDLKINEYGIFLGEERIGGASEAEIYERLGLPWIPPELREDRHEIEAAAQQRLPKLIEPQQIQGDLHVHSNYSDGLVSLTEMVIAAQRLGYTYLAFCDHSKSAFYANGLSEDRLIRQIESLLHWISNLFSFAEYNS